MTKCCEACHTVNRDRAQYCRGCAGRFRDINSSAIRAAQPSTTVPAAPMPAPARAPKAGMPYASRNLPGLLLSAGAALAALLVVWQQWGAAGDARRQPAQRQAQVAPALSQAPAVSRVADAPPVETVPQESLLALTMEQSAGRPLTSQGAWAHLDAQGPETSGVSESDMGLAPDETLVPSPLVASRPAAASTRTARRPSARPVSGATVAAFQAWPAQGITGPCNRYNPFGEVTCATVPGRAGPAHARNARQR